MVCEVKVLIKKDSTHLFASILKCAHTRMEKCMRPEDIINGGKVCKDPF